MAWKYVVLREGALLGFDHHAFKSPVEKMSGEWRRSKKKKALVKINFWRPKKGFS